MSIAKKLGIYNYGSYANIPAAKKAWITIEAKKKGVNPVMVHAGIKATFVKRLNSKNVNKAIRSCKSCGKCPLCGK